jgi:hypothetical protein
VLPDWSVTQALRRLHDDESGRRRMGAAARRHAATFSLDVFAATLHRIVAELGQGKVTK